MKRVIVTGATSNIAISLINKLIREKYYVYAVIRPDTKNRYKIPQNDKISVLDIDMEEISKLGDYNIRACAIYHLRGKESGEKSVTIVICRLKAVRLQKGVWN